jgi:hypothetical protein
MKYLSLLFAAYQILSCTTVLYNQSVEIEVESLV